MAKTSSPWVTILKPSAPSELAGPPIEKCSRAELAERYPDPRAQNGVVFRKLDPMELAQLAVDVARAEPHQWADLIARARKLLGVLGYEPERQEPR